MNKKYLAKIIAKDSIGLKLISAYCFESKVKINELKYLKKNQIYRYCKRNCSLNKGSSAVEHRGVET